MERIASSHLPTLPWSPDLAVAAVVSVSITSVGVGSGWLGLDISLVSQGSAGWLSV